VLCTKSYKIKKNRPTAAAAAAAVSRSTAGGRCAVSPVIGRSSPSLACYRKPDAAVDWLRSSRCDYAYIGVNIRSAAGPTEFRTGNYTFFADCPRSGQSASFFV